MEGKERMLEMSHSMYSSQSSGNKNKVNTYPIKENSQNNLVLEEG